MEEDFLKPIKLDDFVKERDVDVQEEEDSGEFENLDEGQLALLLDDKTLFFSTWKIFFQHPLPFSGSGIPIFFYFLYALVLSFVAFIFLFIPVKLADIEVTDWALWLGMLFVFWILVLFILLLYFFLLFFLPFLLVVTKGICHCQCSFPVNAREL